MMASGFSILVNKGFSPSRRSVQQLSPQQNNQHVYVSVAACLALTDLIAVTSFGNERFIVNENFPPVVVDTLALNHLCATKPPAPDFVNRALGLEQAIKPTVNSSPSDKLPRL